MGKKKKSLTNRLAKMSDEERARYLQQRAAIEEEAKRRKEQLIATYMKNKIKREEAFTRLNVAKINEQWHQILRKIKVDEHRNEIEDLCEWITKIINIKNSIIKKLIQEIEEAEEQHSYSIGTHLTYVDNFIDVHKKRQKDIKDDFEIHRKYLLETAEAEMNFLKNKATEEENYLKTTLFGMEMKFNQVHNEMIAFRNTKLEDNENTLNAELDAMVNNYTTRMNKLWCEINTTLRDYLARTGLRRHHYIELKYLDDRNTIERLCNEKIIADNTMLIETLKDEYTEFCTKAKYKMDNLCETKLSVSEQNQNLKQELLSVIQHDDLQLKYMTVASNKTINELEKIVEKCQHIEHMITCCKRLDINNIKLHRKKLSYNLKEKIDAVNIKLGAEEEIQNIFNESNEFKMVDKLQKLWKSCNEAEIDCLEIRNKKKKIINENENMKNIIKNILIDLALTSYPTSYNELETKLSSAVTKNLNSNFNGLVAVKL